MEVHWNADILWGLQEADLLWNTASGGARKSVVSNVGPIFYNYNIYFATILVRISQPFFFKKKEKTWNQLMLYLFQGFWMPSFVIFLSLVIATNSETEKHCNHMQKFYAFSTCWLLSKSYYNCTIHKDVRSTAAVMSHVSSWVNFNSSTNAISYKDIIYTIEILLFFMGFLLWQTDSKKNEHRVNMWSRRLTWQEQYSSLFPNWQNFYAGSLISGRWVCCSSMLLSRF